MIGGARSRSGSLPACSPISRSRCHVAHVCIAARIRKLLASRVAKRPFIEPLRHMAGAMCCIGLLLYVFLCQRYVQAWVISDFLGHF